MLKTLKTGLPAANTGKEAQIKAEQKAITDLQGKQTIAQEQLNNAERMFKAALKQGDVDPLYKEAVTEARSDLESASTALTGAQQRLSALRKDIDTDAFDQAAEALFDAFATGADTASQRRELNHCLRKAGVLVTLDNERKRVGISIGDGPIDWQPLAEAAVLQALNNHLIETRYKELKFNDQVISKLQSLFPDDEWKAVMEKLRGLEGIAIDQKFKEVPCQASDVPGGLAEALKGLDQFS